MTFPIAPPKASISRTTIPFAGPPMDGLHGINAIISKLIVRTRVFAPIPADAKAASAPACPAPITITSNEPASKFCMFVHSFRLS